MKYSNLYKLEICDAVFRVLRLLRDIGETNLEDGEIDADSDKIDYLDEAECVQTLNNICSVICAEYKKCECPYIEFFDDKLDDIETAMMPLDDKGRNVLLSRAIRFAPVCQYVEFANAEFGRKAFDVLKKIYPHEEYADFSCMLDALEEYMSGLKMFAIDFGLIDTLLIDDEIKQALLEMPDRYFVLDCFYAEGGNPRKKQGKTIPRTHRIAAVWGVINKLNLQAHMDKTNLAAFVEAVTGGNIECKPKDTVAYKEPEKTAKEAADEWLKKIGVK